MFKNRVTVVLITYNSELTVNETLESIRKQTYGCENIELIIADDCSCDDTVAVVKHWLSSFEEAFYKVKVIKNEINLGISKNINNAYQLASSKWIKPIAGDDTLTNNCLEDNFYYVDNNDGCKFLFSYAKSFSRDNANHKSELMPNSITGEFYKLSSLMQYNLLRRTNFPIAPTVFFNKEAFNSIGGVVLKFRNVDDYPLWYRATQKGFKLHLLDSITVNYCIGESISQTQNSLIPFRSMEGWVDIQNRLILPDLKWFELPTKIKVLLYPRILIAVAKRYDNKINLSSVFIIKVLTFFRPPFTKRIASKLKKSLGLSTK